MNRHSPGRNRVAFHTASGPLTVVRRESGYAMDFPVRTSERISPPPTLTAALKTTPTEVHANEFNYMARLETPETVRELMPDPGQLPHWTAAA